MNLMNQFFFQFVCKDVYKRQPGMNAAATVLLAFLRPSLLRLFTPRDNQDNLVPSFKSMGTVSYTHLDVYKRQDRYVPFRSERRISFPYLQEHLGSYFPGCG